MKLYDSFACKRLPICGFSTNTLGNSLRIGSRRIKTLLLEEALGIRIRNYRRYRVV